MPVSGSCSEGTSIIAMSPGLNIPHVQAPDAPTSDATIAQMVEMVVVVVMIVHDVVNRHRALPGRLPPSPLALTALRLCGWWRCGDVHPCPSSQEPADMSHLLGPLSDDVDQILEQLVIAGARLGEGGQSAGIGHEAHPLLLHQLAFPLLGL